MAAEWFRNTEWNESVARAFEKKLRRARNKQQYLRIQASTLASTHPHVALQLLERYFELPDEFDHAQAHVDRATAFLALGSRNHAIDSYEAALAREAAFPNLLTQAYLELPYLIATQKIRERYRRALELLKQNESRLMFPLDHFRWHAARALIAADSNEPIAMTHHGRRALEAARRIHSGIPYHPRAGLVTEQYHRVIRELETYVAADIGSKNISPILDRIRRKFFRQ